MVSSKYRVPVHGYLLSFESDLGIKDNNVIRGPCACVSCEYECFVVVYDGESLLA